MKQSRDLGDARETELIRGARFVGTLLDLDKASRILDHIDWLFEANKTLNLTSIEEVDAVRLHAIDSIAAALEVNASPPGRVLDLGTGGGLPGVPLGIVTGREFVLLDSVGRKATELQRFVESRAIRSNVVCGRAEELVRTERDAFSCVVARAVSALPSLIELAAPLLMLGGDLICLKGVISGQERERGLAAAALCGLSETSTREFALPDGGERRTVLVYRKYSESTLPLPRRTGVAQKRPLA